MTDRISGGGSGSGGGHSGAYMSVAPDAIDRDSVHIDDLADEVGRLEQWHSDGCDALGKCWGEGDEVAKSFEENYLPLKAQLDSYFSALTAAFSKVAQETREMSANFRRDDDGAREDSQILAARMEPARAPQELGERTYLSRLEPRQGKRMLLPYRPEEEAAAENAPRQWAAQRTEPQHLAERRSEPLQPQRLFARSVLAEEGAEDSSTEADPQWQSGQHVYAGDALGDGSVPAEPLRHLPVLRQPGEDTGSEPAVEGVPAGYVDDAHGGWNGGLAPAEPADYGVEPVHEGFVSEPLGSAMGELAPGVPTEHTEPFIEPRTGVEGEPAGGWNGGLVPAAPVDYGVEPAQEGALSEPLRHDQGELLSRVYPADYAEPVANGFASAALGVPAEPVEPGVAPLVDGEDPAPGDGRV